MPGSFGTMRKASPAPGGSILMTSAPKSARSVAAVGAVMKLPQSITFKPSKILPIACVSACAIWVVSSGSFDLRRPEWLAPKYCGRRDRRLTAKMCEQLLGGVNRQGGAAADIRRALLEHPPFSEHRSDCLRTVDSSPHVAPQA